MLYAYENEIKTIIPGKKSKVDRPLHDQKLVLSGIFYIMMSCAQWHLLPDYYGRPTAVHEIFKIWVRLGIFEQILLKSIDIVVNYLGISGSFFSDTSSIKSSIRKVWWQKSYRQI